MPCSSIVTKRESTRYHEASRNVFHAQSKHDLPKIPEHCLPTKYARVSSRSHQDVVMLFCPSFTQSERFLRTDHLITRLQSCSEDKLHAHVVGKCDRERLQVRCSDSVGSDILQGGCACGGGGGRREERGWWWWCGPECTTCVSPYAPTMHAPNWVERSWTQQGRQNCS